MSHVDEQLCFSKNIYVKVCDSHASTKVNSYAMKFISYLWCIYLVLLMLNAWVRYFLLFGWSLLNLFASLHFALSMITTCASKTLLPYESTIPTYMRYFHGVLSKFACAIPTVQNKFLFCVLYYSRGGKG